MKSPPLHSNNQLNRRGSSPAFLFVTSLILGAFACAGGDGPTSDGSDVVIPHDGDTSPLRRLTNEQYNNTIRDLFAPAEVQPILFPQELEGRGGFENNATLAGVTGTLVEAYQRAALSISEQLENQYPKLTGCPELDRDCGRRFLQSFATRAWRRPLGTQEQSDLLEDFDRWTEAHGVEAALSLSIQSLLQSPSFLYLTHFSEERGQEKMTPLSSWEVASRLSYFLWNSMPDDELFELAGTDELTKREVVVEQAWRLLSNWRARGAVVSFHRQLLNFDHIGSNPIDLAYYTPVLQEYLGEGEEDDFSDFYYLEYLPNLRYEPEVFVSQQIFEGPGTLSSLLSSSTVWTTPEIAGLAYQSELEESEPVVWSAINPAVASNGDFSSHFSGEFFPLQLNEKRRAGLLTMAGFLSATSNPQQPSPVARGVTVLDRLLCTHLTPPGDVPPFEESTDGTMPRTNRERYEIHKRSEACAGCHRSIDGIGMSFENYDALGRWRDKDGGYPVDASGELVGTDVDGPVRNAVHLSERLSQSQSVADCYVRQWFRYSFGRDENKSDQPTLDALADGFWQSGGDIPELLVNIAASHAFRHRRRTQ